MSICRVSIIIPTYDRRDSLRRLLAALASQTISSSDFEVVVSIDGSNDGTREMLAQFNAPYRLLSLWQPNSGRAAARNAGIRAASGEVLALLDDDMQPVPTYVEAHLRAHEKQTGIVLIGAVPIQVEASSSPVARLVASVYERHVSRMSQPGHVMELRDFNSGNLSIGRNTLEQVGLFDEDFSEYGNEDREFFLRLIAAGVPIVYSLEALAYQHYEKDFASTAKDRAAAGRTTVLLARKHPELFERIVTAKYRQCSRRWRYSRKTLLILTRLWPGMPALILSSVDSLTRVWPASFRVLGPAALDYIFWTNALSALREQPERKVQHA